MKIKIYDERCIGCGQCESICPEVFKIEDDGLAHVIANEGEDLDTAIESCPTNAIEKSV